MAADHGIISRILYSSDFAPESEISDNRTDSDKSIDVEVSSASLTRSMYSTNDSSQTFGSSKKTKATRSSDPDFRMKLMKTAFLLWNVTTLGWELGQLGPIFPDLQGIAGVSLKQGSWLFTGNAIGYLAGCLLAGFTQNRFSPELMLFFYTMVSAGAFSSLPWIPVFEVMVFVSGVNGIGYGGQETYVHAMLFEIWGDKVGPYVHMIHVLQSFGGIISPLATKPFLRNEQGHYLDANNSVDTTCLQNATPSLVSAVSTNRSNLPNDVTMTDTDVHYALLTSGLLFVSAAVPFLCMFFKRQHAKKSQHQKNAENVCQTDKQKVLPRHIERTVLCIFILNSFIAIAFLDLFPSFLTAFLIQQAGMTQQIGSNLTSAYFAMCTVGNILNIFASIYIKTTKIIIVSYTSTVIMLTCVILSVVFPNKAMLSAFVSLCGVSVATIIPSIFIWIQENVTPVTGTLSSGLLISGSLGITLNPLLVGYLMDVHSPMWFLYLSLVYTAFCAVLFITAMNLTKRYSIKKQLTEDSSTGESRRNETEIEGSEMSVFLNGELQNVHSMDDVLSRMMQDSDSESLNEMSDNIPSSRLTES